jgi:NAD-dependent SIR2 family protein deacetylase
MKFLNRRIRKAKRAIEDAEYIVIGAGAGLSTSAGIEYSGKRFTDNFQDFIDSYGLQDMYSATFYPFESEEEKWAYLSRHVLLNRYEAGKTKVHEDLLELVKNKDYFVLTTNVDAQFKIAGFNDRRIFPFQGDYGLFQCSKGCHNRLYDNEKIIYEMVDRTEDCRIPSSQVPKCPVCGGPMELNLRKDSYFVEDEEWHYKKRLFDEFLSRINGEKVVFLELGVGFNTPTIIRIPFEQMVYNNPNGHLIRVNRDFPGGVEENKHKTISFDEDISLVIGELLK